MKKKWMNWLIAAMLILLSMAGTVSADGREQGPAHRTGALKPPLTDSQRTKLSTVRKTYRETMIGLEGEMALSENRRAFIMEKNEFSFDGLRAQAKAFAALHEKADLAEINAMDEIRSILTPDQWGGYMEALRRMESAGHRDIGDNHGHHDESDEDVHFFHGIWEIHEDDLFAPIFGHTT
ncbi:MAG: hypothetical protein MI863_02455 [Desulfobacterales bacterium]|nr:hypothetical protein [Desulfobacterales bacterium]